MGLLIVVTTQDILTMNKHPQRLDWAEQTPGSDKAIEAGCKCPVLDNAHGWGHYKQWEYVISLECPIHGEQEPTTKDNPRPLQTP